MGEVTEDQRGEPRPAGDFEGVRTVEVNGAALAYREQGDGEAVVFVHGSASDMRTWCHQLPAMGVSHRAIFYSRRYARPNDPIPEGADDPMLPHVEDLVSFMQRVDAAAAHGVGDPAIRYHRSGASHEGVSPGR